MGEPKRQRKKYESPRKPWDKALLEEELRLVGEYGLRNKRELRIAQTMLRKIRVHARSLFGMTDERGHEERTKLIERLIKMGLLAPGATLDDVLKLTVRDILERRLQTVVYRKGLARTVYQARQLVVHGHIAIGDRVVTRPGYLVSRDEEDLVNYAPTSPLSNPEHPLRKSIVEVRTV